MRIVTKPRISHKPDATKKRCSVCGAARYSFNDFGRAIYGSWHYLDNDKRITFAPWCKAGDAP